MLLELWDDLNNSVIMASFDGLDNVHSCLGEDLLHKAAVKTKHEKPNCHAGTLLHRITKVKTFGNPSNESFKWILAPSWRTRSRNVTVSANEQQERSLTTDSAWRLRVWGGRAIFDLRHQSVVSGSFYSPFFLKPRSKCKEVKVENKVQI